MEEPPAAVDAATAAATEADAAVTAAAAEAGAAAAEADAEAAAAAAAAFGSWLHTARVLANRSFIASAALLAEGGVDGAGVEAEPLFFVGVALHFFLETGKERERERG